jgi:PHP domain-containing protein
MNAATIVHRGRWTRADRAHDCWPLLPFEVNSRCRSVTVELDYDSSSGAVIDLGCAGPAGWRGWSGAARRRYVITADAATPGYLPGELEPGDWHVVLGLHRLPQSGVGYTVTVSTNGAGLMGLPHQPPPVPRRTRSRSRMLPAAPGLRWVATDLHAHTVHSDGQLTVDELAALAVSSGLDALAVTDHNTVSHHAELAGAGRRYGIALIPGQEITTEQGHANAFGDIGWVDFRTPAADWVSTVDDRGGLLSINHPLAADCGWWHPLPVRPPLAEVWHASWLARQWSGPLAWWQAWGAEVTPVGGSDWHGPAEPHPLGSPTTWVAVDKDARGPDELVPAVLAGLRAGRTAVTASPTAPALLPVGDEMIAIGAAGTMLVGPQGRRPVRDDRQRFGRPAQVLMDHDGTVVAIAGAGR